MGKTEHHLENSKDLVKTMRDFRLNDDETLVSFDVVSLFTNTPIDKALEVIHERLENDTKLKDRTNLTVQDIMELLKFVLTQHTSNSTTKFTNRNLVRLWAAQYHLL